MTGMKVATGARGRRAGSFGIGSEGGSQEDRLEEEMSGSDLVNSSGAGVLRVEERGGSIPAAGSNVCEGKDGSAHEL